jgi:choline transport protein
MEKKSDETPTYEADDSVGVGEVLNASGHKQELERQFSLLSICSIGITTGNVWAALGGSIVCLQSHCLCLERKLCDGNTDYVQ